MSSRHWRPIAPYDISRVTSLVSRFVLLLVLPALVLLHAPLALAQTSGGPLFAIQGAHTVYELALADGLGRLDYASIAQLWEGWTNRSLCKTAE